VPNSFTTHSGTIDHKGKNYFFYHNGSLPTGGSYRRSICVDSLYYNPNGYIKHIVQITNGVPPTI
jgi:antitoxin component YwqK of YwqJK toxin-antitoxin module